MGEAKQNELLEVFATKTLKDGGMTFDFKSGKFLEPMNYWYFPKYPGLTLIVRKAELYGSLVTFIDANQKLLLEDNTVFGTWVNPKTNKVYIDINTYRADKIDAITTAKTLSSEQGRNIVSIYNPVQNKTEYIEY